MCLEHRRTDKVRYLRADHYVHLLLKDRSLTVKGIAFSALNQCRMLISNPSQLASKSATTSLLDISSQHGSDSMPFESNVGAIVQRHLENFEKECEIEKPSRNDIIKIGWQDVDPHYEVIGEGTYSIVHKVKLLDLKGDFALKFLDPKLLNDNSGEERYKRAAMDLVLEGKLLERISHPNIISLCGVHKGKVKTAINNESFPYFILLEYLPQTLDVVLNEKRKAILQKLFRRQHQVFDRLEHIAVGIASAMEYLHDRGLLFRDLKPSNVGFDVNGTVKLFDLGNCRDLAFSAKTGENLGFAGTPRYMATEVGAGKEYGLPSDVYSFGILLWELITLRIPFDSIDTMEDFQYKVIQSHERPNLSLVKSEQMRSLIQICWDPDPHQRPIFSKVHRELDEVLHGRLGKKTPSSTVQVRQHSHFAGERRSTQNASVQSQLPKGFQRQSSARKNSLGRS